MTDLGHLLGAKNCPVCDLLLRCLKQPENDLFAAAHIKDHLASSPQLERKAFKNSNDWMLWYTSLSVAQKFTNKVTSGENYWPFGSSRDAEDAEQATQQAKELFLAAEDRDIHAGGAQSAMMSNQAALNDAMHAAAFTMGAVSVANPNLGKVSGRQFEAAKLAANEITIMTKHAKGKLPCFIAIRLYGQDEDKFGAISVRVYACGRAPRAAVKEVCHFTLRARDSAKDSSELRVKDGQIWYGRTLQPTVDLAFFRDCLRTCKEQPSHKGTCGDHPPATRFQSKNSWTFRLVDVIDEHIIEPEPIDFFEPKPRFAYVALSYVWGHRAPDPGELVLNAESRTTLSMPGSLRGARLAATIRDAMEIVKGMGHRFLWVEKLCVIQKSHLVPELTKPEQIELKHTIENMGRIYSYAEFTIVDGNSEGSNEGVLWKEFGRDTTGQVVGDINSELSLFLPTTMPSNLTRWES